MKHAVLVLGGALLGGLLGFGAFVWLLGQGFYGLILPGGLLGLGAGLARNRSVWLAVVCGLLAVALGVFAQWHEFPFKKDESLGYFLLHLQDLKPLTLLMIAVGGVIGFWVPYSRIERHGTWRAARGREASGEATKEGPG
jgi:hypothetical protein